VRFAQRVSFDPFPQKYSDAGNHGRSGAVPGSRLLPTDKACQPKSRSPQLASAPLPVQLDFVYRGLGFVLGVIGHKVFAELSKSSGFECSPHLLHQIEIEMQVMNGDEP
jgi:hypothetical protein